MQLVGLLQSGHALNISAVEAGIGEAGEAHGQAVLLALQQGRVGFAGAGLRYFGGYQFHRIIDQ